MTLKLLLLTISQLFHDWDLMHPDEDLPEFVDKFWIELTAYLEKKGRNGHTL